MSITKEEKARRDKLAEQGIRVCGKCKGEKPFDEFNKNKLKTYGLKNTCRSCEKQYTKENKEAIRDKDKKYYQENRGQVIDRQSQYGKKPEVIYRRNKRLRERRKNEPMFNAMDKMRGLIKGGFKRKGWSKDCNTQSIIGCSWEQVVLWVGDEPSKENHLDHVIPQSLAGTPEELKLLNHYTNFQLLPAKENISKGNRYIRKHNLKRVLAHHPQPDKLKEIVERSNVEII